MIKKSKIKKLKENKYRVYSEKGRNMGTYNSKSKAKNRLRQIEFFKHKSKSDDMENTVDDVGVIFESDTKEKLGVEDLFGVEYLFGDQSSGDIATLNRKNPKGVYYYREASLNKKSTGLTSPISYIDRPPDLEEPFSYNEDEDFLYVSEDGEEMPGNKSDLNEKTETFYELEEFMNKTSNIKNYYNIVKLANLTPKHNYRVSQPSYLIYKGKPTAIYTMRVAFNDSEGKLDQEAAQEVTGTKVDVLIIVQIANSMNFTYLGTKEIKSIFEQSSFPDNPNKTVNSESDEFTFGNSRIFIMNMDSYGRKFPKLRSGNTDDQKEWFNKTVPNNLLYPDDEGIKLFREYGLTLKKNTFSKVLREIAESKKDFSSQEEFVQNKVLERYKGQGIQEKFNSAWRQMQSSKPSTSAALFKSIVEKLESGDDVTFYYKNSDIKALGVTDDNKVTVEGTVYNYTDDLKVEINDADIKKAKRGEVLTNAYYGALYAMCVKTMHSKSSDDLKSAEDYAKTLVGKNLGKMDAFMFPPEIIKFYDRVKENKKVTFKTLGIEINPEDTPETNTREYKSGPSSSSSGESKDVVSLSTFFQTNDALEKGSGLQDQNKSHLKGAVKELQSRLQDLTKTDLGKEYGVHYQSYITRILGNDDDARNDGLYGNNVEDTVQAYQKAVNKYLNKNLREDGTLDKATYESLFGGRTDLTSMFSQKGDRIDMSNLFSKKQDSPKKEEKRRSRFGPVSGVPSLTARPPSLSPSPQSTSYSGSFGAPLGSKPPPLSSRGSSTVKDYYNIVKSANEPNSGQGTKNDLEQYFEELKKNKETLGGDEVYREPIELARINLEEEKTFVTNFSNLLMKKQTEKGGRKQNVYNYLMDNYNPETKTTLTNKEFKEVINENFPPLETTAVLAAEHLTNVKLKQKIEYIFKRRELNTDIPDLRYDNHQFNKKQLEAHLIRFINSFYSDYRLYMNEEKKRAGTDAQGQQQKRQQAAQKAQTIKDTVTNYVIRKIFDGIYTDKTIKIDQVMDTAGNIKQEFINTEIVGKNKVEIYGLEGVKEAYTTQAQDEQDGIKNFEKYIKDSVLENDKLKTFLTDSGFKSSDGAEYTQEQKSLQALVNEGKIKKGYGLKSDNTWEDAAEEKVRLIQEKLLVLESTGVASLLNDGVDIKKLQQEVTTALGGTPKDGQYWNAVTNAVKAVYDSTTITPVDDGKTVSQELFTALFGTGKTEVTAKVPDANRTVQKAHIYRENQFSSILYFEDSFGLVLAVRVSTPGSEDIKSAIESASDLKGKTVAQVKSTFSENDGYKLEDYNLGNEKLKENQDFLKGNSSSKFVLSKVTDVEEVKKAYQIPDRSTLDQLGKDVQVDIAQSEDNKKGEEGKGTTLGAGDKEPNALAKSIVINPEEKGKEFDQASLLWSIINDIRQGNLDVRVAKDNNNKNIIKTSKKKMRKAFLESLVYENKFESHIVKTNNSIKLSNMKDPSFRKMALTSSRLDVKQMKQNTEENLNYIHSWLQNNKPGYKDLRGDAQGEAISTAVWNFYRDNIKQIGGTGTRVNTNNAAYYYMAIAELVNYLKGGLTGSEVSKFRGGSREKVEDKTLQFGQFAAKGYKNISKSYDESAMIDWGRSMYYLYNYFENVETQDKNLEQFQLLLQSRYLRDRRLWDTLGINKRKYDIRLSKSNDRKKVSIYKELIKETKNKTKKVFDAIRRRSSV